MTAQIQAHAHALDEPGNTQQQSRPGTARHAAGRHAERRQTLTNLLYPGDREQSPD